MHILLFLLLRAENIFVCYGTQTKMFFCCLPFGLSPVSRIFTKIMKPPMTVLRKTRHQSADYIDDAWLVGKTKREVEQNLMDTRAVLSKLGFVINDKKSVLDPIQKFENLRIVIDSLSRMSA